MIAGYMVLDRTRVDNTEIVLAMNPKAVAPYATWLSKEHSNYQEMFWGHYFANKDAACADYRARVTEVANDAMERKGLPPQAAAATKPKKKNDREAER